MATLLELRSLFSNGILQDKIQVAMIKHAQGILASGTSTVTDRAWALDVLRHPVVHADLGVKYVLAANSGSTLTQINNALADSAAADTTVENALGVAYAQLIAAHSGL